MTREAVVQTLKNSRLFSGLPAEDVKKISLSARQLAFRKNETVFSQGDPAKGFYIVSAGLVKIYQLSKSGGENLLHIFEAGESFGEAAAFGNGFFPAFAEAVQKTDLIFIPIREFKELLSGSPSLSINLIASLSKLLHVLVDQIESLTLKDAGERLARYLLSLSKKHKSLAFRLPTSKASLAARLNVKQETLSRLFARFQAEGFLKVKGSAVSIEDELSLKNLI